MKPQQIILRLWKLEEMWEYHTQPNLNSFGMQTFRRISDMHELQKVVEIQNEQSRLHKELRKQIGMWKYIQYIFAPILTYKSL